MPQTDFSHRPPKTWTKVTITLATSQADTVAAFMADLSETGIEQRETPPGGPDAGQEQVIAYLAADRNPTQIIGTIHSFLAGLAKKPGQMPATVQQEEVVEEDWNRGWKEHFKPFKLTERLVIKPSWEDYQPCGDEVVIEMDPGMAFGTGLHASTKLALLLIEESLAARPANTVLDVGTGTGILGMDCALLGASLVIGVDNDIDARSAAYDNILKNHLEARMRIAPGDLDEVEGVFELVIANITQDVLTLLAPSLMRRLAPAGRLVLSGILTGAQAQAIQKTYAGLGCTVLSSRSQEEWTALLLERH